MVQAYGEIEVTGPRPTTRGDGEPQSIARARRRTWILAAACLVPVAMLPLSLRDPWAVLYDGGPWVAPLILLGFIISEPLVFHIEARNEAVSFSPSDIPLAFGVLLLSPPMLLLVRLLGAAIALLHWRKPPPFKLALNLGAFTVETVIVVTVLRAVVGAQVVPGPRLWVALIGSLMIGLIAGGIIIATAISFFEGGFFARVQKELSHSYLFYLPGALLAASTTVPFLVDSWLVIVCVIPAPVVWVILRTHGSLMHSYADLSEIHSFSSQVGRSAQLGEIAETAVREIATHLRATTVALVAWDGTGRTVEAYLGGQALLEALPRSADDTAWQDPLARGELFSLHDLGDAELATRLRGLGTGDVVVAPLMTSETDVIGALAVADRHGAVTRFDAYDLERLRPLSQQLAVALGKGQLHLQIQHKALHDELTGLPNRAYFAAWVGQQLSSPSARPAAVMMIDLDGFKEVNDTLGHQAGDELLIEVSRRMQTALAGGDLASRFGGDEFAIFVPDVGEEEVSILAATISAALEDPVELEAATIAIAGSIGIALAPDHGDDCETLLRRADLAMYEAKRTHGRSTVFRDDLEGRDSVRLSLLGDLREALTSGSIHVELQPQEDLATGAIAKVEALARWTHPLHHEVPPTVFIPLAEQTGLIGELTEHVLDTSLAALRELLDAGHDLGLAVNISAHSLVDESLPQKVGDSLTRAGVSPGRLTLEITENAMLGDSPRTLDVLRRLDQLGVQISIDDFGTGFSSLKNLRHLPISELKIDRSFIQEMVAGSNDEVLVHSTIDLCRALGLKVVAEGVESEEIRERLREAGCDLAQGFGVCVPLPREQLREVLEEVRRREASGDPLDLTPS